MIWHKFPAPWMRIDGLAWWDETKPRLARLPRRMKKLVRKPVWDLAQNPAGAIVRFLTDSAVIGIRAKSPDNVVMDHITRIGQMGFDLYVAGRYRASAVPDDTGRTDLTREILLDGEAKKLREVTLYLPLYKDVRLISLGIDNGATVRPTRANYRLPKPVVYYGSSITQGGCASNPGMAYPAILTRELNVESVNLGFSGNGLSEPELAAALAEIDAACYVLDQWGNTGTAQNARDRYPRFIEIIRRSRPATPIVVTSPFAVVSQKHSPRADREMAAYLRTLVAQRRRAGDKTITFFDGLRQFGEEDTNATVDGIHCNTLGFHLMAAALGPHMARVLGL
ncbi:MAG: SGNH/GDSL hydrolase family protein [Phycisphaerae bacterium]|nr:SGNH/GDSL hydrolase family protein [Phycisphaerae bacterium]